MNTLVKGDLQIVDTASADFTVSQIPKAVNFNRK